MNMKAAVYYGAGDIRIEDIARPASGTKGMLVRVKACGICPLIDVPHYKMSFPNIDVPPRYEKSAARQPHGVVLGHEFSGEVVETGSEVTGVKEGERVYGVLWNPCGHCDACLSGDFERCNFIDAAGRSINGAMAEYVLFPNVTYPAVAQDKLIKLSPDLTYRDGALLEPLMLGVGLANKAKPADVVVVFGQEIMGLGAVTRLKEIGVSKVITADASERRLQESKGAGADVVVNTLLNSIFDVVMEETSGKGADVVIEVSCRPESLQQAVSVAKPFGAIWLGTFYTAGPFFDPSWQAPGMISMNLTQKPGVSINNAWGTLGPWMPRLLKATEIIQSGKVTADRCVTHVFPLDKTKEAFETAVNTADSIKVMIEP